MIQHKKYDNETTDDMIVLEKEKSNNPVEDKISKKKMKIFNNNKNENI